MAPGLYKHEKAAFLPFLVATPVLFLIGAALLYYLMLPSAWQVLPRLPDAGGAGRPAARAAPKVGEYLSLVMKLIFAFGLSLPAAGAADAAGARRHPSARKRWRKKRRYAIVGVFIVAAIVTPPDPISQISLAIPLCLLYEISIMLAAHGREASAQARGRGEAEDRNDIAAGLTIAAVVRAADPRGRAPSQAAIHRRPVRSRRDSHQTAGHARPQDDSRRSQALRRRPDAARPRRCSRRRSWRSTPARRARPDAAAGASSAAQRGLADRSAPPSPRARTPRPDGRGGAASRTAMEEAEAEEQAAVGRSSISCWPAIPNLPAADVPDGADADANVEIRRHGNPAQLRRSRRSSISRSARRSA